MKKNTNSEAGFASIVLVALLALVLIVAGVAIYNARHTTKTSSVSTGTPSASATPAASPTPAATYLHIKELGIKIQLHDNLKDVVYTYGGQSLADPQEGGVSVSSQSLIAASAACGSASHSPLGAIGKTKNPDQVFGMLSPDNKTVFKFGDYYVYYRTPQSSCGAPQSLQNQQFQSFKQAFQTVQAD
jgi:hypothetical protein